MFGIFDGVGRGCSLFVGGATVLGLAIFVPASMGDYVKNDDLARYKHYQSAYVQQNWPKDFRPNVAVTSTCEHRGDTYAQSRVTNLRTGEEVPTLYGIALSWGNDKYCGDLSNQGVPGLVAVAIDKNGTLLGVQKGKMEFTIPVPAGGTTLLQLPTKNTANKVPLGESLVPNNDGTISLPANVKQP